MGKESEPKNNNSPANLARRRFLKLVGSGALMSAGALVMGESIYDTFGNLTNQRNRINAVADRAVTPPTESELTVSNQKLADFNQGVSDAIDVHDPQKINRFVNANENDLKQAFSVLDQNNSNLKLKGQLYYERGLNDKELTNVFVMLGSALPFTAAMLYFMDQFHPRENRNLKKAVRPKPKTT
jgi:hypothetical protein